MDQISLAKKAGTSRKWLVEVEQGKPGAEIGLILRTLKSLEISIDLEANPERDSLVATPTPGKEKAPDINSVLDSLKKRPLKKQI
jgi:HTH-type transcriptional regulator/antitoxin HipB